LSSAPHEAVREVAVPNREGLHARPVMKFVDLANKHKAAIAVTNLSRNGRETVDGKSAMHMMLLEATQGNVLRIHAVGSDATEAVDVLAALVSAGFQMD
jgi:phosphotransferase system HPr (HPr) family protein